MIAAKRPRRLVGVRLSAGTIDELCQ
jgi:hypothetical protein